MKIILLLVFTLFISTIGITQHLIQTVRGTITDFDTRLPIIGAKVVIQYSEPFQGAVTNFNGDFRIENVKVGRIEIKITSEGYQDIQVPNLLVESGKEKILNFEMVEDIEFLDQVEVTAQDKSQSINKMATVSGKTFTVEETNRYAGSLNDPARMVSGFAGVSGDAEGDNNIVVRGNSPRGILWRLEGIDIPNPNHFSGEGATGGPVNALNGSVLANSDFFSGAFAPEYGNALSGVFDVKFRQGNNEKREYAFSAGVLGLDATIEGPFKKGYRGSYLINYRYSTISLLDQLGILDFDGIPVYQDASFKIVLPTKHSGTFSLIGLGGISQIDQTDQNDSTGAVYGRYNFGANLGVVGLKHTYILNPKLYVKSYVSLSTSFNGGEGEFLNSDSLLFLAERESFIDNKLAAQTILNYKLNKKNMFQVGITLTRMNYDFFYEDDYDEDGIMTSFLKSNGNADKIQSFVSWKHRVNNKLTVVTGMHYTQFFLNDNYAIEPRAGVKYQASKRHDFSAGFGLHSRMESISTYLYNEIQTDGSYKYVNKNLDFSKSTHYVLGYGFQINENMRLKSEIYYQNLYNIPVENDSTSSFSLINSTQGIPDVTMVNKGTGRNYGAELTLERFFHNNFYFLLTGSVYKSQYTALDGVERNTRYDATFASNLILGKEFNFGKQGNKTFGINTKVSLLGGNRYTPIDLMASKNAGYTVRVWDKPFTAKGDNIFLLNLGLTYRVNKPKVSHAFKIDIQNLTNNQAVVSEYYNGRTEQVEQDYQLSFIPNLVYTLKF
jgi:hypothetical protein